eukprot:CAMPEP_0182447622 /NCGR_PEP_ID=MMETSP1172-20130603/18140_1 /TAXON_ID=708627 /ORGANISM="Timspurckia oligopyrenoides, Strain CCMP3278" /LENGTH=641 /DNA_ID=CAMNT_0024644129 /DNA_START=410 /DNA_END=2335 /DNA_ORIENTATION=+
MLYVLLWMMSILMCARFGAADPWIFEIPAEDENAVYQSCCVAVITGTNVLAVAGWTNSALPGSSGSNAGGFDAYLLFFNQDSGEVIGSRFIGTSGEETADKLIYVESTDQLVLLGTTSGTFPGQENRGGVDLFMSVIPSASSTDPADMDITSLQYGSVGDDIPNDLLFYRSNQYLATASGSTAESTRFGQSNALVLFRVTSSLQVQRTETITFAEGQFSFFRVYSSAVRGPTADEFAITFELSQVPSGGIQRYFIVEFDNTFSEIYRREILSQFGLSDAYRFQPDHMDYSAESNAYWLAGTDPGYGNPYREPAYPSPAGGVSFLVGRVIPETNQAGYTSEAATRPDMQQNTYLVLDDPGTRYVSFWTVFPEESDGDSLVELQTIQWRSRNYDATNLVGARLTTGRSQDNWNVEKVTDMNSQGFMMIGAERWNLEENPFNCMGSSERRNLSFALVSVDVLRAVADFGSACPEIMVDITEASNFVYFAVGSTTGSLTGQTRLNAGATNTTVVTRVEVNLDLPVDDRIQIPTVDTTCDLPCSSIPPPTPTPTPTPTPSSTPTLEPSLRPSPTPTFTPEPVVTPTPGPTTTLYPLPKRDPVRAGIIAAAIVGAIAGSALVIGLASFIYYRKQIQGRAEAADGYYY